MADSQLPDWPPAVSVVGRSNVGKTTLLVKLIAELKRRGYRVATVKHDAHGFQIDTPGKDSWRHAEAGSDVVFIASAQKLAMIKKIERELTIDEIRTMATDVDILITEGYKRGDKLKIEVSRRERSEQLLCDEKELLAIASDQEFAVEVPQFDLDDATGIVDLLEREVIRKRK